MMYVFFFGYRPHRSIIQMLTTLLTSLSSYKENTALGKQFQITRIRNKGILTLSISPKANVLESRGGRSSAKSSRKIRARIRPRPPRSERPGVWPHLYTRVTHRVTCPASTARQGSDCCSVREGGADGWAGGRRTGRGRGRVGRASSPGISLPRPPAADQSRPDALLCYRAALRGVAYLPHFPLL